MNLKGIKNNIVKKVRHCDVVNCRLDPYSFLKKKSERLSWNGVSDIGSSLDKVAAIEWLAKLRDYSDESVNLIIVKGIFDNEFHNISFILNLIQSKDFQHLSSLESYVFINDFVADMPNTFREWIDESDFFMTQNVLALLAKKRRVY